jgi:hypothetical protein
VGRTLINVASAPSRLARWCLRRDFRRPAPAQARHRRLGIAKMAEAALAWPGDQRAAFLQGSCLKPYPA